MNEDNKKKKSKKKRADGDGGTPITYKELRVIAKNMAIPRYSQMRKGELSKAINYRKTHPKVRFGKRPKKKVMRVHIYPTSRSERTRNDKEIPKDRPLLSTKIITYKKGVPANVSEIEIKNRKVKHREESKNYLRKNNIRSVSDYLEYMMKEYDPDSRASVYKAKKLAGYVEYLI